jgi:hypothetical protein
MISFVLNFTQTSGINVTFKFKLHNKYKPNLYNIICWKIKLDKSVFLPAFMNNIICDNIIKNFIKFGFN